MSDPEFQAIWHDLNEAQVALVLASDETSKALRLTLLREAQLRTKQADLKIKEALADRSNS